MAREMKGYRDLLELYTNKYPSRIALRLGEVAEICGVSEQTIKAAIERPHNPLPAQNIGGGKNNKTYSITITALARWQCGGTT